MNIKLRMIGNRLDSGEMLFNLEKMQIGTKILIEKFPIKRDIGVLTIIENFDEKKNEFQICVKDSQGKELGRGDLFRSRVLSSDKEGIIVYNINSAYFEKKDDFYTIELFNKEKILDKYSISCDTNIYNIYQNLDDRGTIEIF